MKPQQDKEQKAIKGKAEETPIDERKIARQQHTPHFSNRRDDR